MSLNTVKWRHLMSLRSKLIMDHDRAISYLNNAGVAVEGESIQTTRAIQEITAQTSQAQLAVVDDHLETIIREYLDDPKLVQSVVDGGSSLLSVYLTIQEFNRDMEKGNV